MFQVGEREREREREREPRSKRFYDTGRRHDITSRRFLCIGKVPEFPPPSPFCLPSNYVSLLNALSFHMQRLCARIFFPESVNF